MAANGEPRRGVRIQYIDTESVTHEGWPEDIADARCLCGWWYRVPQPESDSAPQGDTHMTP